MYSTEISLFKLLYLLSFWGFIYYLEVSVVESQVLV